MIEWWFELSTAQQFFYGVGIVALALTILQTLLALLGMGFEGLFGLFDFDLGGDGGGMGLFSSHTISAFFLGFGWGGALSLSGGLELPLATLIATVSGGGMMAAMFFLLRALLGLQSDGTLRYETAVGQEATVYVTIPGDGEDGGGQIQILVQGRLITARARRSSNGRLAPGERVKVVAMAGPTSYLVEPVADSA